ncbi:hypothetical protein AB4Y96_16270 [Phyllobacterium sp. TAF24]|uniref:hypothetical protein n=1 Tax=Phyllobacterium sp. TAF24 TaxID=3233068 RepID=UPI003F94841F
MVVNNSDIIKFLDKAAMHPNQLDIDRKRELLSQAVAQIRGLHGQVGKGRAEMSYIPYFAEDLEISARSLENLPDQLTNNLFFRAASLIRSLRSKKRVSKDSSPFEQNE